MSQQPKGEGGLFPPERREALEAEMAAYVVKFSDIDITNPNMQEEIPETERLSYGLEDENEKEKGEERLVTWMQVEGQAGLLAVSTPRDIEHHRKAEMHSNKVVRGPYINPLFRAMYPAYVSSPSPKLFPYVFTRGKHTVGLKVDTLPLLTHKLDPENKDIKISDFGPSGHRAIHRYCLALFNARQIFE